MGVTYQGLDEIIAALRRAPGSLEVEVEAALVGGAELAVDQISAGWPVDTGESLLGFTVDGTDVVNPVDYVPYVHDGLVEDLATAAAPEVEAEVTRRIEAAVTRILE